MNAGGGRREAGGESAPTHPGAVNGVVLSGTGGVWQVRTADGMVVEASLRGRLKLGEQEVGTRGGAAPPASRRPPPALKLAVGDEVTVAPDVRGGAWAICDILPRRSSLARRAPGGAYGERIVAANVDQVVVVFAAAKPEPHPRMLDRFLVIAEANDLAAHVLVNKVDLVGEDAARERFAPYARAGYPLHLVSAKQGTGFEDVRATLTGQTSVFTGPSGVGKSSLLNALFPGLKLRVGEISESVNKGRHTTVGALMIPLPDARGGYVVDTPGLREVGMWALPPEHLDECFPEFRPYIGECRFQDCTHTVEPGCAIRDAMAAEVISASRYDSYVKLLGELEEAEY